MFSPYHQIPYEEEYMNSKPAQAKVSPQTKMPPQANNQQTSSSEPHLPKMGRSGRFLSSMNPFKPKEKRNPPTSYFITKARFMNDAMHVKFVPARKPVIIHPKREDRETCGFVFGVDEAFTVAHSSITLLQESKIPFVFLTNGGGATEIDGVIELEKKLHVEDLDEEQYIQASTPFKDLVPQYKDKNILVIGAGAREVAKAYGFKNVLTGADIHSVHHGTTFSEITCSSYEYYCSHGCSKDYILNSDGKLQISAILIFSDIDSQSRDLDLQLITDLLLSSKGIIGTVSEWNGQNSFPNRGYGQDDQPAIYFSNSNSAFKTALEEFWAKETENARFPQVGKPSRSMFELANESLQAQHQKINGADAKEVKKIYMINSTFSTEMMQGANDLSWTSILLRKNGEPTPDSSPRCAPSISIRGGIQDAIKYAMSAPSLRPKSNCKFIVGASESEEGSFEISKQDLGPEFSFGPERESFETVSESENSVGTDDNLDKKSSSASSAPDKSDEEEQKQKKKGEVVHELEPIPHVSGDWPPMLTGAQEME
jgi:HAD superfamily hydrolase (TIGR01450 family)